MQPSTEEHIAAAVEALDAKPFRYWVSGFSRVQMREVVQQLAARFPERGIILTEFFPPFDQCVIIATQGTAQSPATLKRIARERDTLAERGVPERDLPK